MKIWFKHYRKRDGEIITYMNNDRKCSIAFDESGCLPAQYGKRPWTGGQAKLVAAFHEGIDALIEEQPIATGADLSKAGESELVSKIGRGWFLVGADTATIGGVSVKNDGVYLVSPQGSVYPARLSV